MLYRLSPGFPHYLTVGIWNGERKEQFAVNLYYIKTKLICKNSFYFFYYLGFLSQPFTNRRTAGERGGHFFDSSLPFPSASQTLRH